MQWTVFQYFSLSSSLVPPLVFQPLSSPSLLLCFLCLIPVSNKLKISLFLLSLSLSFTATTSGGSGGASWRCRSRWHFHPLLVIKKTVFLSLQGAGQTQPPPNKKISVLSKAISFSRVFLECSALKSWPHSPRPMFCKRWERKREKEAFLKWFMVR